MKFYIIAIVFFVWFQIRFAVRESYPVERAKDRNIPNLEDLTNILSRAKKGEPLKKILNPHLGTFFT